MPENKLKKAITLILIFSLLSTSLGGCWNQREIQDINVNTALGFDQIIVDGQPQYRLSVLSLRPTSSSGKSEIGTGMKSDGVSGSAKVITVEGNTVYDAVRNYTLRSSRQLFMGHVVLIVIGRDTASSGVTQIADYLSRHKDIRMRSIITVCDGLASDCLMSQPEFEQVTSIEIYDILDKNSQRGSKSIKTDLFRFTYSLLTPGREAIVPHLVTMLPPEEDMSSGQTGFSLQNEPNANQGENPSKKIPIIYGSGVFLEDRMVGFLNPEETQGLMFITGKAQGGVITVAFDASQDNISYLFRAVSASTKVDIREGRPIIDVKIKGTGEMLEQNDAVMGMSREDRAKLEELVNQEVIRKCELVVARSQELGSDIFGFGDEIHRFKPQVWKELQDQWPEIYPKVAVNITADFKVEHTGIAGKGIVVR